MTHTTDGLLEDDINLKVEELRVLAEAKRRIAAESLNSAYDIPEFQVISEVPDMPQWRIEGLISTGAYVMISAQKKVGKTTLVLNLIRSLINGTLFLGEFRVVRKAKVALIDFEMSDYHLADWMRKSSLLGDDRLITMSLRGRAKALGIFDDERREHIVHQLQDNAVDVLIIDPLGPLLRAYGIDENDNTSVGQTVDLIIKMALDAGVSEIVIVHHNGKDDGLGARGASVFGDTPTSTWQLKKDDRQGGLRSLSITGREGDDLFFPMSFDADTKKLTKLDGDGAFVPLDNKKCIIDGLRAQGPISAHALFEQIKKVGYKSNETALGEQLKQMEEDGLVRKSAGKWALPH